jgi:tetratricopeptide (TPR) repeat protein
MVISALLLTVAIGPQDQPVPRAHEVRQIQQGQGGVRAGPPAPAEDVGRAYFLFLEGQSLADADDMPGAIARYRQAIELLGDSGEIRAELANIHARQGNIAEARAEAERALAADDSSRAAHRILGLILASDVQRSAPEDLPMLLPRAIRHLERALADGFEDLAVQLTLAEVYLRDGQHDTAIAQLTDFLQGRPGYPQATMLLIQAYRAAGRTAEADALVAELRGGLDRPASPTRDARQFEDQGRWDEAADAWAAAVADAPENRQYRLRHAAALTNAGRLSEARDRLLEVANDWPGDASAWYLLTQVELRDGQPDAAEGAAMRIVDIDPDDPRGPLALAEVRLRRGNHRGVIAALGERVAAASPDDIESGVYSRMANLLASALVAIDESQQALQTLETALAQAPDDLDLLFSLAATYERTSEFDRAERAFRDLVSADPGHAAGLNYLGYMLAERGRKLDEAVSFITRALAIDADNPAYLDSLGWAYFKQSRFDEALSPLERAASGAPGSSVIQEHLGDLYLQLKRYQEAEAAFGRALAGDRDGIDAETVQQKRARARALGGRD